MTPDPIDPAEQWPFRVIDQSRRIPGCAPNCPCKQDDAMTTPLDLEDTE